MNFKIFIHKYLTPRHSLTQLVGKFASAKCGKLTTLAIKAFVKLNRVNLEEASHPTPSYYKTFNEFFIRELPTETRPLGEATYVSPADGRVTVAGEVTDNTLIQAKGHKFTLSELLAVSSEETRQYEGHSYLTIYLSPRDYHRVHMPCTGKLLKTVFIPGDLYSVNQNAFENIPNLYARNERLVCYFETEKGIMIQILVGATITGSIKVYFDEAYDAKHAVHIIERDYRDQNIVLEKGEVMGAFLMGSTTINIFPEQITFTDVANTGNIIKVRESIGN